MPIPRRTALAWKAICLAERSPVMEQPEDKVRKVANRRARITRLQHKESGKEGPHTPQTAGKYAAK